MKREAYWSQVLFADFIRHFRKLDDAGIVADIRQSMDDLETMNAEGYSFGASLVAAAFARMAGNRTRYASYGVLGGRPRKNPNSATASGKSADVLPLCGGSTPAGTGLPQACSRPGREEGIGRNGNVFIDPGELAAIEAEYGDVAPAIDEISDILANDPERYRNHAAQLRRVLAVRRKEGRAPDGHKITQEERLAAHFAAQAMAESAGKETINHKPQPQIRKAKNETRIDRKSEAAAAERALCESLGVASLESV